MPNATEVRTQKTFFSNTMADNNNELFHKVQTFLENGCGCAQGYQFSKETVLSNLNNCLELSSGELDLVILANIQGLFASTALERKEPGAVDVASIFSRGQYARNVSTFVWNQLFDISSTKRTL